MTLLTLTENVNKLNTTHYFDTKNILQITRVNENILTINISNLIIYEIIF